MEERKECQDFPEEKYEDLDFPEEFKKADFSEDDLEENDFSEIKNVEESLKDDIFAIDNIYPEEDESEEEDLIDIDGEECKTEDVSSENEFVVNLEAEELNISEPGVKSKKKMSKRKKRFLIALVAALLVIIGIYGSIVVKFYSGIAKVVPEDEVDPTATEVQIAEKEKLEDEVVNILLVGTDTLDPDAEMGRSDTMMLVSFNKTQNKTTVVSFLRDSLVEIDGYGKSKLGHTYAYGGVGLTINTINKVYDLDIQNYITISFDSLINVIDEMDGVKVPITEEEAEYYRYTGIMRVDAGEVTLTGSQALAHARNRTLGSDFERSRRQRSVMYGVYKKIMEERDPADVMSLIVYSMDQVKTNMNVTEIYNLAMEVLTIDNLMMQQAAIPQEGMYEAATYEGMDVLKIDIKENKKYLKRLLY